MARVRLAMILLGLAVATMRASDWTAIAPTVLKSIVKIEQGSATCTGFVVDAEKDTVITAGHCLVDETKLLYVDGKPSSILEKVPGDRDLLVLKAPNLDKPALKLSANQPKVGDYVATYGYGYGLERPTFRVLQIEDTHAEAPEVSGARFFLFNPSFEGGQSGGPIVNDLGEVVGIVQMGNMQTGLGLNTDALREKVGKYFVTK